MKPFPPQPYLYLATDGTFSKIGITCQPEIRIKNLTSPARRKRKPRVRMVHVWHMVAGAPRNVESEVIQHFRRFAVSGREWFSTSSDEIFAFVEANRPRHWQVIDGVLVEQPHI